MKALAIFALILGTTLSAFGATASDLYKEAQRAHLAGNTKLAKAKYLEVLEIDSGHVQARNYLRIIATNEKANPTNTTLKQLEALQLKEINLNQASLGSVLDFIRERAKEDSNGSVTLNFVPRLTPEMMENTKVTLKLSSIPYSVALTYIGDLAKVKFDYQQHAIVVSPLASPVSATEAASPATSAE